MGPVAAEGPRAAARTSPDLPDPIRVSPNNEASDRAHAPGLAEAGQPRGVPQSSDSRAADAQSHAPPCRRPEHGFPKSRVAARWAAAASRCTVGTTRVAVRAHSIGSRIGNTPGSSDQPNDQAKTGLQARGRQPERSYSATRQVIHSFHRFIHSLTPLTRVNRYAVSVQSSRKDPFVCG